MKSGRVMLICGLVAASIRANGQDAVEEVPDNPDFSPVTEAVDTDGDGRMSRAEWQSAGLPESSFNMFENGRGYVTQTDYDVNAAPEGIDLDGDGRLTVEEFIVFDRTMSANMPPGGGLPPDGNAPGASDGEAPTSDGAER